METKGIIMSKGQTTPHEIDGVFFDLNAAMVQEIGRTVAAMRPKPDADIALAAEIGGRKINHAYGMILNSQGEIIELIDKFPAGKYLMDFQGIMIDCLRVGMAHRNFLEFIERYNAGVMKYGLKPITPNDILRDIESNFSSHISVGHTEQMVISQILGPDGKMRPEVAEKIAGGGMVSIYTERPCCFVCQIIMLGANMLSREKIFAIEGRTNFDIERKIWEMTGRIHKDRGESEAAIADFRSGFAVSGADAVSTIPCRMLEESGMTIGATEDFEKHHLNRHFCCFPIMSADPYTGGVMYFLQKHVDHIKEAVTDVDISDNMAGYVAQFGPRGEIPQGPQFERINILIRHLYEKSISEDPSKRPEKTAMRTVVRHSSGLEEVRMQKFYRTVATLLEGELKYFKTPEERGLSACGHDHECRLTRAGQETGTRSERSIPLESWSERIATSSGYTTPTAMEEFSHSSALERLMSVRREGATVSV